MHLPGSAGKVKVLHLQSEKFLRETPCNTLQHGATVWAICSGVAPAR